jgi:hypothetical protein
MMTFVELFREGQKIDPLDNGTYARSKAQEVLSANGVTFTTDLSSTSIVNGAMVGIAFYSLPDLELLDQLVLACGSKTGSDSESVLVFDVLDCKGMRDFEQLIPGIGPVYQTPVVGLWKDSKLIEKGTGAKGRMLLSKRCWPKE